jgi:hypothetical protein
MRLMYGTDREQKSARGRWFERCRLGWGVHRRAAKMVSVGRHYVVANDAESDPKEKLRYDTPYKFMRDKGGGHDDDIDFRGWCTCQDD